MTKLTWRSWVSWTGNSETWKTGNSYLNFVLQACYILDRKLIEDDDPTDPATVSKTVDVQKYGLPDGTRFVRSVGPTERQFQLILHSVSFNAPGSMSTDHNPYNALVLKSSFPSQQQWEAVSFVLTQITNARLTYMMVTAEQQHRRRAKLKLKGPFYCTYALARLRCNVIVLRYPTCFVPPPCKSIYRVYITKQANITPLRPSFLLTAP